MIEIDIPFRLPGLNEYTNACRGNKYGGGSFKKSVEQDIMLILNTHHFFIDYPVMIYFEWHEKDRRRDKDNVAFAKKFILDALQKCGKLKNDSNKFVVGFRDDFVYKNGEGCKVRIERFYENQCISAEPTR